MDDDLTVKNNGVHKWEPDEEAYLYTERLVGTPYTVIARNLGRSFQAVKQKYDRTDWASLGYTSNAATRAKKRELAIFREKTENTQKRSIDRYRMRVDILGDSLREVARTLPVAPRNVYKPRNKKRHRSPEDMGLMLSDLHIGHEHTLEETGGISQYNVSIFKQRMKNLQYGVAEMYEIHSEHRVVPKLHVFCLGDIVAGMNQTGAWSPVYIGPSVMEQTLMGIRELSDSIWYWLTIFDEVEFYGIRGNHGRIAPTGAEKDFNNWDVMVYECLAMEFRNNKRVKFNVPHTWWHSADIRGHKFLLMHGDDVKSKNPPIASFIEQERKMAGYIDNHSHYTLAGHFHNCSEITSTNGKIFMNGSFVGSDVYSLKNCLPGTRAEQKLFGIHDKCGVTWRYDMDLDIKRENFEEKDKSNVAASKVGMAVSS